MLCLQRWLLHHQQCIWNMPERRWTRRSEWQHKTATKQKREPLRVTSGLYVVSIFAKNDTLDTGYLAYTLESNNRKVTTCNPGRECKVTIRAWFFQSLPPLRLLWIKVCSYVTKFSQSPIFSPLLPSANTVAERQCFHKHVSRILSTGRWGGVHPLGHPPTRTDRHPPSPADGYCSGRYASYWNTGIRSNRTYKRNRCAREICTNKVLCDVFSSQSSNDKRRWLWMGGSWALRKATRVWWIRWGMDKIWFDRY